MGQSATADQAAELLHNLHRWQNERTAQGRSGEAVGLTWAPVIQAEPGEYDEPQPARVVANARSLLSALEPWEEADVSEDQGYIIVRVIRPDGTFTEAARVAWEIWAGLADYPIVDEEMDSEVREEGFEREWEEVVSDIERGNIWAHTPRRSVDIIDDLPDVWKDRLWTAYDAQGPDDLEDDLGYRAVDRTALGGALDELDWEDDED
jgi:hypothetical protein